MNEFSSKQAFQPKPADSAGVLSWVHLGDLHMTAPGEQNDLDLQRIVAEINTVFSNSISFVFLPGDVADDGSRAAYSVVRRSLDQLQTPWCAILGDHDVHEKSFANFLEAMSPATSFAFTAHSTRFIAMNAFDVAHPGSFTVSEDQLAWVERELVQASTQGQTKVLFLHCYPTDLKVGGPQLSRLVAKHNVRLIDMGHTHYNEIANDGHTLYTATRSTGQIEEGPAGFSVTNIDGDAISWRFVEVDDLPVVIITSPSDQRLSLDTNLPVSAPLTVRAKIWSKTEIEAANASIGSLEIPMKRLGLSQVWEGSFAAHSPAQGLLRVTARESGGKTASDQIRIPSGAAPALIRHERDQENSLEAWPEHGLLGTQLGPNKNGKKW